MSIPYVALLRGVNVGGKNKLPMKDLAALLAENGCVDVRTYIQSGNAVFRSAETDESRLAGRLAGAILERFGLKVPVVLRTANELVEVLKNNPFLGQGLSEERLHVVFLADVPGPERVATLDPTRSPPDEFVVRGREIYLHLPNGAGNSKLTNAYFDTRLATVSTVRNWRTAGTLLGMMGE